MKISKSYFSMLLLLCSWVAVADSLDRRASWQAKFEPFSTPQPGRVIKSVEEGSPLKLAGMVSGDRLIAVNQQVITSAEVWNDLTDALVSNQIYRIQFKRNQAMNEVSVEFTPIALETHHGLDTIYDAITSDYSIQQRVIVTKPEGEDQPMPAIVVLQGLSCSSVEQIPDRESAFVRLLTEIVENSGLVVMRVEKPGMGDSEGNCSETDFRTELNGYESAIKWFLNQPYVNAENVIVYGNSMGSALAPYMANKFKLAGVISDGTFVRSWFEHMLEIERRILNFKGYSQTDITQKMTAEYIPLYYGMLVKKQSYQDVINQNKSLATANYHGPAHMYGRPLSYYHQLQDFDVAGQWAQLSAPARIRWGTNDWIMSEADNDMILRILEQSGHHDHQLYKHPGLDHWQAIHKSSQDSFDGKGGQWDESISNVILDWLGELTN